MPAPVAAHMKPRGGSLNQPVDFLDGDEPLVRLTQVDIPREMGFWFLEAEDADEVRDPEAAA